MNRTIKIYAVALISVVSLLVQQSCSDMIDVPAYGVLSEDQLNTRESAEGFVIAAYSQMGNDHYTYPFSLWPFGNVRSDDAYKGGRDPNDQGNYHFLENFSLVQVNIASANLIWYRAYIGVRRANEGLRIVSTFSEAQYPEVEIRKGELRFIRGYWYFMLKILFKHIPYFDETMQAQEYEAISNRVLTSDELWNKIAGDFEFASSVLPVTQPEVGRANKVAAYAFLAKTRLYQAYEQDDNHAVININPQRLQQVIDAADQVLSSAYDLEPDFANNFLPGSFENGQESIFAVQFSINDGAGASGRLNKGDYLSAPQGLGCCDFQKISHNLVNAFRTDAQGLPRFNDYNESIADFASDVFDPRMDHTVSRPGVPWKYEKNRLVTQSWSRTPSIYGYFNSMKENVSPDCDCYKIDGSFRGNSKNRIILRYADVLLFKAEALIELGRQDEALPLINAVRERAAQSTARLTDANDVPLANYHVEVYKPGENIVWDQENARQALRFERRLEFALEGSRFFDLVRWGIAEEVMNDYIESEKVRRPNIYQNGFFTKGRDEYLPIPQTQINFSKGLYQQNVGY